MSRSSAPAFLNHLCADTSGAGSEGIPHFDHGGSRGSVFHSAYQIIYDMSHSGCCRYSIRIHRVCHSREKQPVHTPAGGLCHLDVDEIIHPVASFPLAFSLILCQNRSYKELFSCVFWFW